MTLHDILAVKGTSVHVIRPDTTLDEVVRELVRFNIGSLMVCEKSTQAMDSRILGIITERDILRACATGPAQWDKLQVDDVMSADLITALPADRIENAMRCMTKHRVRHLPVVEGKKLCGIISIGDIVKAHHDQLEMDNYYMQSYIQGEGAELTTPPDRQ